MLVKLLPLLLFYVTLALFVWGVTRQLRETRDSEPSSPRTIKLVWFRFLLLMAAICFLGSLGVLIQWAVSHKSGHASETQAR